MLIAALQNKGQKTTADQGRCHFLQTVRLGVAGESNESELAVFKNEYLRPVVEPRKTLCFTAERPIADTIARKNPRCLQDVAARLPIRKLLEQLRAASKCIATAKEQTQKNQRAPHSEHPPKQPTSAVFIFAHLVFSVCYQIHPLGKQPTSAVLPFYFASRHHQITLPMTRTVSAKSPRSGISIGEYVGLMLDRISVPGVRSNRLTRTPSSMPTA